MSALIFADGRPTSCGDDLYQWAMDAEAMIRNLHTENTALRVTEDNLRQELQECQDQRRAAFRRIEELDAMRAQIGQGEPIGWLYDWTHSSALGKPDEQFTSFTNDEVHAHKHSNVRPVFDKQSTAPQQKPLTDEQDRALCEAYCNAASDEYFKARPQLDSDVNRRIFYAGHRKAWIEWQAAHNIGEKK